MDKVWIAGQHSNETWMIHGIFPDKEKAEKACIDAFNQDLPKIPTEKLKAKHRDRFFVGAIPFNKQLSNKVDESEWEDLTYPCKIKGDK